MIATRIYVRFLFCSNPALRNLLVFIDRRGQAALKREKKLQQTMLAIKKKYGRNSIVRGMSLEEGATARERNKQIGGHKA